MHSLAFTKEKPDYTNPNRNKLHHVQNLLNTLETICEKLYNPGCDVALDEQVIKNYYLLL